MAPRDPRIPLRLVLKPTDFIWDSESKQAILSIKELWCSFFTLYVAVYNACIDLLPADSHTTFILERLDVICDEVLRRSPMAEHQRVLVRQAKRAPREELANLGDIWKVLQETEPPKDDVFGQALKLHITGKVAEYSPGLFANAFVNANDKKETDLVAKAKNKKNSFRYAYALLHGAMIRPEMFMHYAVGVHEVIQEAVCVHLSTETCRREAWWPQDMGKTMNMGNLARKVGIQADLRIDNVDALVSILGIQGLVLQFNLDPPEAGDLAKGIVLRMRKVPRDVNDSKEGFLVLKDCPSPVEQQQQPEPMTDELQIHTFDRQASDFQESVEDTQRGRQTDIDDTDNIEYKPDDKDADCDTLSAQLAKMVLGKSKRFAIEPTSDDSDSEMAPSKKKRKVDTEKKGNKGEADNPYNLVSSSSSDDDEVVDITDERMQAAAVEEEEEEDEAYETPPPEEEEMDTSVGEGKQEKGQPAYSAQDVGEGRQEMDVGHQEAEMDVGEQEAEMDVSVGEGKQEMDTVAALIKDTDLKRDLYKEEWKMDAAYALVKLLAQQEEDAPLGDAAVRKLLLQKSPSLFERCIAALDVPKPKGRQLLLHLESDDDLPALFIKAMTSSLSLDQDTFNKAATKALLAAMGQPVEQCIILCMMCVADTLVLSDKIARIAWLPNGSKAERLQTCWYKIMARLGIRDRQNPDNMGFDADALNQHKDNTELFWAWTCWTLLALRDPETTRRNWDSMFQGGMTFIDAGVKDWNTALMFLSAFFFAGAADKPYVQQVPDPDLKKRCVLDKDLKLRLELWDVPVQYDGKELYATWALRHARDFRDAFVVHYTGDKSYKGAGYSDLGSLCDKLPKLVEKQKKDENQDETLRRYEEIGDTFRSCYLYSMLLRKQGQLTEEDEVPQVRRNECLHLKLHAGLHYQWDEGKDVLHKDTRVSLLYMLSLSNVGRVGFHLGNGFRLVQKLKPGNILRLRSSKVYSSAEALKKVAQQTKQRRAEKKKKKKAEAAKKKAAKE